jgi:outer membrane protein assembly factor BamB
MSSAPLTAPPDDAATPDAAASRRRFLSRLGTAALAGAAGCTSLRERYFPHSRDSDADLSGRDGPWPTLGHDARRTGATGATGPSGDADLTRVSGANHFPDRQVVVGGDRLLFAVRNWRAADRDEGERFSGVLAFDRAGSERWRLRTDPDVGVPTVVGNTALIEEGHGTRAVDLATGTVRWHYRSGYGFPHVAPGFADGRVFVGGRRFLALDAVTGERLWRTDEELPAAQTCAVAGDRVVVSNGYGGNGGGLFCLDAATGRVLWEAPLSPTYDPVAVAEETCYAVDETGVLSAVSVSDGSLRWARGPVVDGAHSRYEGAVLAGDLVLAGGWNRPLTAFDRETGDLAWTAGPDDERHQVPVVASDGVYAVTREGTIYEVGFDGTERWRRSVARTLTSPPSLADGDLYVGSLRGETVEEWQGGYERFGR